MIKGLRKGYTTGSCAAAAAKAAIKALLGNSVKSVFITTLEGEIEIPINKTLINNDTAICTVIKDAGDDPDITNSTPICAEVCLNDTGNINISGGKGIGKVTLPGLKVEVGKAAINPVPMKMIKLEVLKVLDKSKGADIIISAPLGEELAKKTFNPRLGIVGGISILGTSGIVNPMSEEAYKESLSLSLDLLAARGIDEAIFIFGEYGKAYLATLNLNKDICITTSNFIGYMLDYSLEKNFKRITIVGHIGKLVKVAGGIFYTHSKIADCRMEILTSYAALAGADLKVLNKIYNCNNTTAAIQIIDDYCLSEVYKTIVNNVKLKSEQRLYNQVNIEVILFGDNNRLLAKTF